MGQNVIKWGEVAQPKDKWGKRCYHDHPALPITIGEVTYFVHGGSCGTPAWEECDIYVGLDGHMAEHEQRLPWVEGHAIHYRITDGCAPKNPVEFGQLIDWLADQVLDDKVVHVGCIGGHGRTGLVLSALVATMTGNKDSTTYVREQYCKKAVESTEQIEFLAKHFGIKKVPPSKPVSFGGSKAKVTRTRTFSPVKDPALIWGDWHVGVDKR